MSRIGSLGSHVEIDKNYIKADTYQYNAISDGIKMVYTDEDELLEYGNRGILNPEDVSYYNVFINGILQPKSAYTIETGLLMLKTSDVPKKGVPVIIVFVTLIKTTDYNIDSTKVEGNTPFGHICNGPDLDHGISIVIGSDTPQTYLKLRKAISTDTKCVIAGSIIVWEINLTIVNTGDHTVENIIISNTLLLDLIINITESNPTLGSIYTSNKLIKWNIPILHSKQSATFSISLTGLFRSPGTRFISSAFAIGNSDFGPVYSDIISSEYFEVLNGPEITKTITSGPIAIVTNSMATWRVELKIVNSSDFTISNILVTDKLLVDELEHIEIISITEGIINKSHREIEWNIDSLKSFDQLLLVYEIRGFFLYDGYGNLGDVTVSGNVFKNKIFIGPIRDIQLIIYPYELHYPEQTVLFEKFITGKSLFTLVGKANTWHYTISITNQNKFPLNNIIISDYILIDDLYSIETQFITLGNVSIYDGFIRWNVKRLLPGESINATFSISGIFNIPGNRSLGRGLVFAQNSITMDCLFSDIVSGPAIMSQVLLIEDICIVADKVYSRYRQKYYGDDYFIKLQDASYKTIVFECGFIKESTLTVKSIKNKPNYKEISFILSIPYEILTNKKKSITGILPDIHRKCIVFMPEARDEFEFNVIPETKTRVTNIKITPDNVLTFSFEAIIIIEIVGEVQLLIPTIKAPLQIPQAEKYVNTTIEKKLVNSGNDHSFNVDCSPSIFGNLNIEKTILCGPAIIYPLFNSTWKIEIKVTNKDYGPIYNIVLTDSIILDYVSDINILSFSQGNATVERSKLKWNIRILNSVSTAVIVLEIKGFFNIKKAQINVDNQYYHSVLDNNQDNNDVNEKLKIYVDDSTSVSYYNLFINGVLQPPVNYKIDDGIVTLNTIDNPIVGTPIILESFIFKDSHNNILPVETSQFNTYATENSVYSSSDEIIIYGNKGILDPNRFSYCQLYVNGVIQPKTNYTIKKDTLLLTTIDKPISGSHICIQFVTIFRNRKIIF